MNLVQQQNYSNKNSKKTFSKVTTAKSSRKYSTTDDGLEGIVKSEKFKTLYPLEPQKYIKAIRKNVFLFPQYTAFAERVIKKDQRQETGQLLQNEVWKFTISVIKKFQFSYETLALAVGYYLKFLFSSLKAIQNPFYLKKFHISVCIYLAAKTIELQRKIPKPPAFQYFCSQNYTAEDYNKFQRQLTQALGFDLQKTTIFTFLELYLSLGIFYQNQILETGLEIEDLQKEILEKGIQSMRKAEFLHHEDGNPEAEAIRIIKEIRKKYYLTEENKCLQYLWDKEGFSLNQSKFSSNLKSSRSMGNLLNISRSNSTYTQRIKQQNFQSRNCQVQNKGLLLTRKSNKKIEHIERVNYGNQILKRKPNLDKSYKKKNYLDEMKFQKLDQTQNLKYVTLKDQVLLKNEDEILKKELIRCKSASSTIGLLSGVTIKYQKNSNSEGGPVEEKTTGASSCTASIYSKDDPLKPSLIEARRYQPLEGLSRLSFQSEKSSKKLSRFAQLTEDRIIQKSRSKSKKESEKSMRKLESSKHFHRKKNPTNLREEVQNRTVYRNR